MATTAFVTSEQYLALPDEFDQNGNRIKDELIGGEIVRMPPSSLRRDRVKNLINRILTRHLDANPHVGFESLVETGAEVAKYDTFVPDVGVVSVDRLSPEGRILKGAPGIAIEVVSPSDSAKKLNKKIDAYPQGGSKSVWVVYPETRSVTVYASGSRQELKGDQTIEAPFLPGFSVPVSAFFDLT